MDDAHLVSGPQTSDLEHEVISASLGQPEFARVSGRLGEHQVRELDVQLS